MNLKSLWAWLENSPLGSYIASSDNAFPLLETLHVISIITVVGTILIMDLRLLGVASKNQSVTIVSKETLPITWIAFVCAAITGLLLFTSKATTYTINPWFLSKMVLIALAGVNMGIFHFFTWRTVGGWNAPGTVPPIEAKVSAGLSLAFWLVVLFCGRMIGFTLGIYHT